MKRAARVRRQPHPCCCAAGAAAAQLPRASREVRRAASPQNYVLGPLCARRASRPCLVPRQGEAAPHPQSSTGGGGAPPSENREIFRHFFAQAKKLLYTAYKVAPKLRFGVDKNFVFIWRGIPARGRKPTLFLYIKKALSPGKWAPGTSGACGLRPPPLLVASQWRLVLRNEAKMLRIF